MASTADGYIASRGKNYSKILRLVRVSLKMWLLSWTIRGQRYIALTLISLTLWSQPVLLTFGPLDYQPL